MSSMPTGNSVGSYGARRLVQRCQLNSGETLPSYVDRMADLYKTTTRAILERLGLWREKVINWHGYGVVLDERSVLHMAFVCGWSPSQIEAILFAQYLGTLVGSEAKEALEELRYKAGHLFAVDWVYLKGSHFCPICLRESGGVWLHRWKLPWSFACVKHKCFLIDRCPKCGLRPRTGRLRNWTPSYPNQIPAPCRCNNEIKSNARGSEPCGCEFSLLPKMRAPASVLRAQNVIDSVIATGSNGVAAKQEFIAEMRGVSVLILYALDEEDFGAMPDSMKCAIEAHVRSRQRMRRDEKSPNRKRAQRFLLGKAPSSSALMAAVIVNALAIVRPSSAKSAHAKLELLGKRFLEKIPRPMRWRLIDRCRLSARLRLLFDRFIGSRRRFDRRVGARSPSVLRGMNSLSYTPRNVPQIIDRRGYKKRFGKFFADVKENLARRFCSMSAVKLLGFTWLEAASLLELPNGERLANYMIGKLGRDGNYERFTAALYSWANSLSKMGEKIDYEMRRTALRSTMFFSVVKWKELCAHGSIAPGTSTARSRFAAAWAWADATSGDWRLAPSLVGDSYTHQSQGYQRTALTLSPAMKAVLRAVTKDLIERYSRKVNERVIR